MSTSHCTPPPVGSTPFRGADEVRQTRKYGAWRGCSLAAVDGADRPLCPARLALTQPETLDLAGRRFRQLVDELDVARVLVRRELVLDERLERFLQCRVRSVPGLQDHERLRLREAIRIL